MRKDADTNVHYYTRPCRSFLKSSWKPTAVKIHLNLYLDLLLDLPAGRFAKGCPSKLQTSTYTLLSPSDLQDQPITVTTAHYVTYFTYLLHRAESFLRS